MTKRVKIIAGIFLFMLLFLGGKKTVEAATKIHYLGLKGSTDAILLESDGRFGLIDSGEDWDYPNGEDPRYPWRKGIDTSNGHEQQVIYYMKKIGVTNNNFDFYLGTHAHSDHIGTGDEVLSVFTPKVVYLKQYADTNIKNKNARWDNRYVYDNLVNAANSKSTLVQTFKEGMTIKLGKNMKITLYNTKVRKGVVDENWNSIVAKVKAYNTTTILAADAMPSVLNKLAKDGKFGKIDILKLPHHGYIDNNPSSLMTKLAPKQAIVTGPMSNVQTQTRQALEAKKTNIKSNNTGMAALVTKYSAAGYATSAQSIKAGWLNYKKDRYYIQKNGRPVTGWKEISGKLYCFNAHGKVRTGWASNGENIYYLSKNGKSKGTILKGWQTIDGKEYYFSKKDGKMLTGWQKSGDKYFFFTKSGAYGKKGSMYVGWKTINKKVFYFKTTGNKGIKGTMLEGWQKSNGINYIYFKKSGAIGTRGSLLTGWQKLDNRWFYFKKSGTNGSTTKKLSGWHKIKKKYYYFRPGKGKFDGYTYMNGTYTINGKKYTFDKNGALTKGKVPTPTPTPKPTATPRPMATPIPTPTATPIVTPTPMATPKPTAIPIATPRPTATPTATPRPTVTPTATPRPTVTVTATPRPTATVTSKPRATLELTE